MKRPQILTQRIATFGATLVVATASLLSAVPLASALPSNYELTSKNTSGQVPHLGAGQSVISANGRYVAFVANSEDMPNSPTDGSSAILVYEYDRLTGVTQAVSVNTAGEIPNSSSNTPFISADGRYVLFQSTATNIVPGHGGNDYHYQIYKRDTVTHTTTYLAEGTAYGLSTDGTKLTYIELEPSYESFYAQKDLTTGVVTYLYDLSGHRLPASTIHASPDGNIVLFDSYANLTADATGTNEKIYVRNMTNGVTTLWSHDTQFDSVSQDISADASTIAYSTYHVNEFGNLLSSELFVANLNTGVTTSVDTGSYIDAASLSANGQSVAYYGSPYNSPNPGGNPSLISVKLRNLSTGTTQIVCSAHTLSATNDFCDLSPQHKTISADGSTVTFMTSMDPATTPNAVYTYGPTVAPIAPLVSVTSPTANSTVSGTVTINGTILSTLPYNLMLYVFDSSSHAVVSRYQYNLPATATTTGYSWNTSGLPNGTYTINLSAKDSAGNKIAGSTSVVKVTVNN